MEAGLAQYKEADKTGAGRILRLGAATIGAAAGVPDALIKARWMRNLSPEIRDSFLGKMADSLVHRFSRYVGREEGEQLARLTIGGMVRKAALGGGAESGQEAAEDIVNKAFASVTYKPEMTWQDVISPERELNADMAAGLVGLFGGGLVLSRRIWPMTNWSMPKASWMKLSRAARSQLSKEQRPSLRLKPNLRPGKRRSHLKHQQVFLFGQTRRWSQVRR